MRGHPFEPSRYVSQIFRFISSQPHPCFIGHIARGAAAAIDQVFDEVGLLLHCRGLA